MRVSHVNFQVLCGVARSAANPSGAAQRRWLLLRSIAAMGLKGVPVCEACCLVGISRATFYRWAALLREGSVEALEPRSRRPKRSRPAWVRRAIGEAVQALRKNTTDGKEKLVVLLARQGLKASASSVARCLRELFARGVIDRYVPGGKPRNWRPRPPRPHAVRTPKDLRPSEPGEIVQVDTLFIEWERVSWRQFSAIDRVSRHVGGQLGQRARASDAEAFLTQLITASPYPIRSIQVDQGVEFKEVFELACQELGIVLYENHARTPKQNAFVERLQRTFRDEFYRRTLLSDDVNEANQALQGYIDRYNHHRPHAGLKYRTPIEYLQTHWTPSFVS